jgi:hydrogenase nickel incorporation protein HypA/HybF
MHEASLARGILDAVLERARAGGAARIRTVKGWVAETESLSADSISFHFAAHARGTPAEGARLDLRLVHVQARCRGCGAEYAPEHHVLLCPACGAPDGELLGRTGLGVESIEVDAP